MDKGAGGSRISALQGLSAEGGRGGTREGLGTGKGEENGLR